jgi:hypothetical protein
MKKMYDKLIGNEANLVAIGQWMKAEVKSQKT